jgi:UDP-N-acetylmuramoyl-tripeptide--D-alanyl-D-alanine ligase
MKHIFKKIVISILTWESKKILSKYKPKIIAVTGSVGKTSTKDALYTALSPFFHVRKTAKSFNSDIGIPLTILGLQNVWNDPKGWLINIWKGFLLCIGKKEYPEYLVLEIGADRPGEIRKVMGWIHPDASVVTRVGKVPVHVEFYASPLEVAKEKSELVKGVKKDGVVILNRDDEDVYFMRKDTSARVVSFAIENDADVKASFPSYIYTDGKVSGISFKVDIKGNSVPVSIVGSVGKQHIYPVLASLSLVYALNLSLLKGADAFKGHELSNGRMRILDGREDTVIIDDTYNASPVAMEEGLNTLRGIETEGRKIAVLGDMLELGKYSPSEHKRLGVVASKSAQIVVGVGIRAKDLVAEASLLLGEDKVFWFDDAQKAGEFLKNFIKPKDVIYAKGSQGIRLERAVKEILKEGLSPKDFLVRQEEEWLKR